MWHGPPLGSYHLPITSQSPSRKNPLKHEGDCTSLPQAVHCLFHPTRSGNWKAYEGPPPTITTVWTPHTGYSMWEASQQPLGRWALPLPRGLTGSPCFTLQSRWARPGLPIGTLQPLTCQRWLFSNLEELGHSPDFEGRDSLKPGLLLPPHLTLLCSAVKILERHIAPSPIHCRGAVHTSLLRHSAASALLPISATVVSGFNQCKPPSRTIAIAADISKVFDTVSHCLPSLG